MPDTLASSPSTLVAIALVFVLAGLVKGVVGMGLPTVAIGLLGLLMTPAQAAALLIVPSLATNLWQWLAGPSTGPVARRLATMMIAVLVSTIALAGLIDAGDGRAARLGLGAALLVYAGLGLTAFSWRVPASRERWLSPLVGALTGAIAAATGVFVLPAVAYLQSLALERDALVQALGLSFTVSTIGLAIGLGAHGLLDAGQAMQSSLALAPAAIGMAVGTAWRRRLSPAAFRRGLFVGLGLLGLHLCASALR